MLGKLKHCPETKFIQIHECKTVDIYLLMSILWKFQVALDTNPHYQYSVYSRGT